MFKGIVFVYMSNFYIQGYQRRIRLNLTDRELVVFYKLFLNKHIERFSTELKLQETMNLRK